MSIKQKTEEKVFSFMEEHCMLNSHDKVVAGISGGADSVCLLFVLLEYRKRLPFSLAVVHVNHGIREDAGTDAGYVEALCRQYEIPFYPFHIDVRRKAKQEKCSEEEAGRIARYDAFARTAEQLGANKIAVAHNCNDRSETMLFNLFRGSGMKGLCSIRPVRENIIRPILCLERKEVEAYLKERGIAYCQDSTNEKDDYTRNRIRHHILPYAEQEIASGCVAHMAQTAELLLEAEDYLEQQTAAAMQECVRTRGTAELPVSGAEIEINTFLKNHNVIRSRILYKVITALAVTERDISQVHVKDLLTLFTENGNRIICLPYGMQGRRQYDKVILERSPKKEQAAMSPGTCACNELLQENLTLSQMSREEDGGRTDRDGPLCKVFLPDGRRLECRLCSEEIVLGEFPSDPYTKWFDYDRIEKSMVLRTRRTGDYLMIAGPDGQMVHKSLKEYMITEKIPKHERDRIPLIAVGSHIIWLIGYRISEACKINRNTKQVLQVQLIGKGCDSNKTEEKNG